MKKIFLIGDSIRMGYCQTVRELMAGEAEVNFPAENCRFTQYTYVQLEHWAAQAGNAAETDLVCWNNGHWDIAHWMKDEDDALNSIEEYCVMLRRVYKRIRSLFPKAKILFFTTTTREEGAGMAHPRSNEEIRAYNQAACAVMEELGVPVSDMCAFSETLPENRFADGIHFTPECFQQLGRYAADEIRKLL